MLPSRYLTGLDVDPFGGAPGVFAVAHARRPGSWRYLSSYRDGKAHKARIFALLAAHGQPERPGDWDLHHVVEGQHYADVDFGNELPALYADQLPCVLVHKREHHAYNGLLHSRETDELFRDVLPRALADRSREVAAEYATAAGARDARALAGLRERVRRLAANYRGVYDGDPVLQRVAANVLAAAEQRLR